MFSVLWIWWVKGSSKVNFLCFILLFYLNFWKNYTAQCNFTYFDWGIDSRSSAHPFSVPSIEGVSWFRDRVDPWIFKSLWMFLDPKKCNCTTPYEFFPKLGPSMQFYQAWLGGEFQSEYLLESNSVLWCGFNNIRRRVLPIP